MHVLFLPSWFATADKPWRGTFVQDQALALTRAGVKAGVAFVERRSLSKLNLATLLASHVASLNAHRVVTFAGALPRWHVRQCMWDANALVLPSDAETFGVVLIEALSTGLPVIATRCGGPEEIVTPDVGALVERGDEEALLRAMEELMWRRFDPLRLRETTRRRFDYALVAERLRALYEQIPVRRREVA